jgi:hypothetical protein
MFCKKCYSPLSDQSAIGDVPELSAVGKPIKLPYATARSYRCSKCGKRYDPNRPRTYYQNPFPSPIEITGLFLVTTFFGILAAAFVAFFQMAQMSGH